MNICRQLSDSSSDIYCRIWRCARTARYSHATLLKSPSSYIFMKNGALIFWTKSWRSTICKLMGPRDLGDLRYGVICFVALYWYPLYLLFIWLSVYKGLYHFCKCVVFCIKVRQGSGGPLQPVLVYALSRTFTKFTPRNLLMLCWN